VIGDAPMDYLMAENSGIKNVILTTTGQLPFNELRMMTPFVINSLTEITIK
jgi:phosphoglycolate phosphatase-like HAD superfamily hydrolase